MTEQSGFESATNDDDRLFLRSLQNGDEAAHGEAFERYADALYNFVMHRCHRQSSMAEDVVQEVFLRLFRDCKNLAKVDNDQRLYAWLCGMAGNILATRLRADRRHSARVVTLELDEVILSAIAALDTQPLPEKAEEREAVRTVVNRTLSALPPRQQNLLRLKYLENLSVQEIAARLNTRPHAVETALWRARGVFQEVFKRVAKEAAYE